MARWGVVISCEQELPSCSEESKLLPIILVCEDGWEGWAPPLVWEVKKLSIVLLVPEGDSAAPEGFLYLLPLLLWSTQPPTHRTSEDASTRTRLEACVIGLTEETSAGSTCTAEDTGTEASAGADGQTQQLPWKDHMRIAQSGETFHGGHGRGGTLHVHQT